MAKTADIDVNKQGFSEEEYEEKERLEKKHKKDLTPEEKARLEQLKNKQNQRKQAISILRGISIRMPLLIYGADLKNEKHEITIDNFADIVDNASWKEFMPQDVTKRVFAKFKKYYDPDVFREAGKRIREMARLADKFTIEERILRIATIFNTFRNPDKESGADAVACRQHAHERLLRRLVLLRQGLQGYARHTAIHLASWRYRQCLCDRQPYPRNQLEEWSLSALLCLQHLPLTG